MSRTTAAVFVFFCFVCPELATAQQLDAIYVGTDSLWSNPAGWDIGVVPCNAGGTSFRVTVPTEVVRDAALAVCAVDELNLSPGAQVRTLFNTSTTAAACSVGAGALLMTNGGSLVCESAAVAAPSSLVASLGSLTVKTPRIDAGIPDDGSPPHAVISISSLALLDLPTTTTVRAPAGRGHRLDLSVSFGTLLVPSLASIETAGEGHTFVRASGGSVAMPSLASATNLDLFATGSGDLLGTISTAGSPPWVLDWSTVPDRILGAGGGGQLLLPTLTELDADFDSGLPLANVGDTVAARDGGVVDLSGLVTVRAPVRPIATLAFTVFDASSLLLPSLASITSTGGYTRFNASGAGASLVLPALTSAQNSVFEAFNGGTLSLEAPALSYSWAGHTFGPKLFDTDGAGSVLAANNIAVLDAGFDDDDPDFRNLGAYAFSAAQLQLGGVVKTIAPVRAEDELLVMADSGASIDLHALRTIDAAGAGLTRFQNDGATLLLGALSPLTPASLTTSDFSGDALVDVAGDARPAGTTTISLSGGGSQLRVGGDLVIDAPSTLVATDTTVAVGGDVESASFASGRDLSSASLRMNGSGVQALEVGGFDGGVDFAAPFNFEIAQLVVGDDARATTVALRDRCDNGNQFGTPEALYLFGVNPASPLAAHAPGADGLRILGGSTLDLGGIPAYAYQGGAWLKLNDLIPGGVGEIAYDGGFLRADDLDSDGVGDAVDDCPSVPDADQTDGDADGVGDACDNCRTVANPREACGYLSENPWATLTGGQRDDDHDGYGNRCDAKFTSGLIVAAGDLTQLRSSLGKNRASDSCGTSGAEPCAIYDLDQANPLISSTDLTVFRTLNGKQPGPKCPACPLACDAGGAGSCSP